ncbi:MAG: phosphotransferase [Gammaproteobacteria bacterium]|nr:phosphotransferase [Gammaproteobacteria bacterium]
MPMDAEVTRAAFMPELPEELTAEWLTEVLGIEVEGVEQTVLGEGQGFMGDILRLSLHSHAQAAPASVIAKLPKRVNRGMGEMIGVYEREIMFFRTLAEEMPVRIPKLVYADFDRDRGSESQEKILRFLDRMPRFLIGVIARAGARIAAGKQRRYVLLLEDLAPMQPADQLAGLDTDGCKRVLEAIAPMHRHFWRSERLQGHFWLLPFDVDARLRHGRFRQNRERIAASLDADLGATLAWLDPNGEALVRRFVAEAPETLAHCDMRLDNVMFGEKDCAFIDWQLLRRAPAALDVAYFLSGALHEDAGADAEREVLAHYHRVLDVDDYDFATFQRDYQRAMLMHLATLANTDEVDFGNERGDAMMQAWMRRLTARVRDIDPVALMA